MLFLYRVLQFILALAVLCLVLATLDHVFSLGIWHDRYPGFGTNAQGKEVSVGYGEFMFQFGAVAVGALLIMGVLNAIASIWLNRLMDRAEREAEDSD